MCNRSVFSGAFSVSASAISKQKFSATALTTSQALSQWRPHAVSPSIGVKGKVNRSLDSLARIQRLHVSLRIDKEGSRSSIIPRLVCSECLFILHQLTSSSFQLMARVTTSLCSRTIPQHCGHGWSHRQNTGQQASKIGLSPASVFGAHFWSQSLFESLPLGCPTSRRMAWRHVNQGIRFGFLSRTACLHQQMHPALNSRWRKSWL